MQDRLGDAHERLVPAAERHARGQYFTPIPVIQLVLDLLPGRPTSVLDPACGSGRFLLGAAGRWPTAGLHGLETDPEALRLARTNLPDATLAATSFLDATPSPVDLVLGNPPYVRDRGRKRDLYVDFIERSARWLGPGGRLAFVLSAAWLDVGYGAEVRQLLQTDFAIEWIVESSAERWFPGAKVNTMVLVARREPDAAVRAAQEVRFATVREALPATPVVGRTMRQSDLGADMPWGVFLRAPDLWLEGRPALPTLGALATVRRGFTTNANRFFYPSDAAREGIEPRYLRPLLKSPKRVPGVRAAAAALTDAVFVCEDPAEGTGAGARQWIRANDRESWGLPAQTPARLFLPKGYGDRFRSPLFDAPVFCDQQLYQVLPASGVDEKALAALLNSTWFRLSLELVGRVNFGDGVLWLGLEDARRIPLPDPRGGEEALSAAFDGLPDGPVPPLPELAAAADWDRAQQALDAVVSELMGFSGEQIATVHAAASALCARRVRKAASVRNPSIRQRSK